MSPQGVSVAQLVDALKRKGVPLPFEVGTFVALEACERVVPAPAVVGSSDIWLSDDGDITVAAQRTDSEEDAVRSLIELVGELLVQSAPGVPPTLLAVVERGPSSGQWVLPALRDDLEAALVPLNRAATRRILSRLLREAQRGGERGRGVRVVDELTLDSELDEFLGVQPGEAGLALSRPELRTEPAVVPENSRELEFHASLEGRRPARGGSALPAETAGAYEAPPEVEPAPTATPRAQARVRRARPGRARVRRPDAVELDDELAAFERGGRSGGGKGRLIGIGLVFAAALMAVAYFSLGRARIRAALGLVDAPSQQAAAPAPPPPAPKPARGRLEVTSTPARAQVLMFVGQAPAVVSDLPIGVAHEFVALSEGSAPARAVVPRDAVWQEAGGVPQYELALQARPDDKGRASDELGPTQLPSDVGAPTGALGKVRVITSPPGAKVYQLIGFTPDVRVDNIPTAEPVELLVYLRGYQLGHAKVATGDYVTVDGEQVARVDLTLER